MEKIKKVIASAPALQKLADRDKWAYAQDWECELAFSTCGTINIKIRKGYWTDLASVPRGLRGLFDNGSGEYGVLVASQIHDMIYSTHYFYKDMADELFFQLLRFYKMSYAKAKLYYLAVHWFGDKAWETLSPEEQERDQALCSVFWGP